MFAKLFERDGKQVLVKVDANNDNSNPEVRFFFEPEGLGVCSSAFVYKDESDKSWDIAEKFFAEVDETKAFEIVGRFISDLVDGLIEKQNP